MRLSIHASIYTECIKFLFHKPLNYPLFMEGHFISIINTGYTRYEKNWRAQQKQKALYSFSHSSSRQCSLKAQEIVALSFKLQKYKKFWLILLLSLLFNVIVLFLNFSNLSAKCKVCELVCPFYFVSLP